MTLNFVANQLDKLEAGHFAVGRNDDDGVSVGSFVAYVDGRGAFVDLDVPSFDAIFKDHLLKDALDSLSVEVEFLEAIARFFGETRRWCTQGALRIEEYLRIDDLSMIGATILFGGAVGRSSVVSEKDRFCQLNAKVGIVDSFVDKIENDDIGGRLWLDCLVELLLCCVQPRLKHGDCAETIAIVGECGVAEDAVFGGVNPVLFFRMDVRRSDDLYRV